nr:DUF5684 domain-containing protein [Halomarina rubra]
MLAIALVSVAGMWKAFEKAGKPGWGAIIPFYNTYLMIKIGENSGWWLLGLLVPVVNFFVALKLMVDVADRFGQGLGFGIGLTLLSFVFWPLLGFGEYTYRPTETAAAGGDWR